MATDTPAAEPTTNAVHLAVQRINDAGGLDLNGRAHRLVLLIESIPSTPDEAMNATRRLINQSDVSALIGPHRSRTALPVGTVAENARVPMISPGSTHPQTTADKHYVFRVAYLDPFQGEVMARFAVEDLHAHKAAILFDAANTYNQGIAEIFKEAFQARGGEIVAYEMYTTGEQDFQAPLSRIRENAPDVLFLPNYNADVILQSRQARALGIDATLLGSDGWTPNELTPLSELNGAFFTYYWHPDVAQENEQARIFIERFRQVYGEDPPIVSALGYDAIGVLIDAITRAGQPDPEAIREALAQTEGYPGVTGAITYRGQGGDPKKPVLILQMKDGIVTLYKRVNP